MMNSCQHRRGRGAFQLPMSATFNITREEHRCIAHALDFDLVCVAETEDAAIEKLRLAVKTYIEYGLSNNWAEDIPFPAPPQFWELPPDTPTKLLPPIHIEDNRLIIFGAMIANAREQAACQAC